MWRWVLGIVIGLQTSMSALLAFAKPKNYPKAPLDLQVQVGWLMLAVVICGGIWLWTRRDTLRRAVLGLEDPRIYAVLRFGVAWFLFQSFWNLYPYWRMLWSDEGMFLIDAARSRYGSTALSGWTQEDGFLDGWAIARFFWGKHSLFLIHGSPAFVSAYMSVFFAVLVTYAVGFRTRCTGVLAWMMMLDIYDRTSLYSEGTDSAFRCLFFILLFAHTGSAWSVDNWWRVRRERRHRADSRRAGHRVFDRWRLVDHLVTWLWLVGWVVLFCLVVDFDLSGPLTLAGFALGILCVEAWAHHHIASRDFDPRDASPVVLYKLVPKWPRVLIIFQWTLLYVTTGVVKTGHVWQRGDALYYALNMDHFYRFEGITQKVSALFSLGIFRIFTWVTHYWEMCFFLVPLGVFLAFCERHRNTHWYRAEMARRGQIWLGRLMLVAAYLVVYRAAFVVFPFCLAIPEGKPPIDPAPGLRVIHIIFAVAVPSVLVVWNYLRWRPARLWPRGLKFRRWTIPALTIDGPFLRKWLLGRRIWLGTGALFHGKLIAFMNIGMFPFIMLQGYWGFFRSRDLIGVMRAWLALVDRKKASKSRFWRVMLRLFSGRRRRALETWFGPEQPAEDARRSEHFIFHPETWMAKPGTGVARGAQFSGGWLAAFMLGGVALILMRALRRDISNLLFDLTGERIAVDWMGESVAIWWLAIFCVAVVACFRRSPDASQCQRPVGVALISSPVVRVAALSLVVFHGACVGLKLFPTFPVFSALRSGTNGVFGNWMRVTHTTQSWRMFAPNPPRSNSFMQTVVIEHDGDQWDLRSNALHDRPNPWIVNDRMRKMQRRMIGKGKWYLSYWTGFQCREWELRTGEQPELIVVNKLWSRIPSPSQVFFKGPYVPSELSLKTEEVKRIECSDSHLLPAYIKRRYGLEISEADLERERRLEQQMQRRDERNKRSWLRRKNFGGDGAAPKNTPAKGDEG